VEIQFHRASGRGAVRTVALSGRGESLLLAAAALTVVAFCSLWFTVPAVALQRLRAGDARALERETRVVRTAWGRTRDSALALRERALVSGDALNRIAFLYGLTPSEWPRVLDPDRGLLVSEDPAATTEAMGLYLRALDRARETIARRDQEAPDVAAAVPVILPVAAGLFEPAAVFGPRTSPWTGREEFFPGIEIAAPAGSTVVAAGAGTIAFTGRIRPSPAGWLWRLGNLVVVSHGQSGATLYGHLSKVEVRRGAKIARGDRLGVVGTTGWALSPMVHYQYWHPGPEGLHPTDPLYCILDRRMERGLASLPRMWATKFPGGIESLPGVP
jgi:murein DD-endopeptidase MepM/ murein hydrolase activator NlpD